MPPRGLEPSGIILVDKPAGPSSFAIVNRVRARTGTRMGHAGTLDPFATGLLLLLSGRVDKIGGIVRRAPQALSRRRRPDGDHHDRRPGGRASPSGTSRLRRTSWSGCSRASGARSSCRSRLPPRSRSAASAPTACTAAASPSRCRCGARGSTRSTSSRTTDDAVRLDLRVSSGTYVRAIAEALGGHCTHPATHRGRPVLGRRGERGADHPGRPGSGAAVVTEPPPSRSGRSTGSTSGTGACSRRRWRRASPCG